MHVVFFRELTERVGVLAAMDVPGLLLASVVLVSQAAGPDGVPWPRGSGVLLCAVGAAL
jgi:hypothetical protein